MNAAAAAAARPRPVQKLPEMQSSARKASKVSANRIPEKKSKSPARRPKRRPDSASAAPSRSSSHATSEQAQVQVQSNQQHQADIDQFAAAPAQAQVQVPTTAWQERSHSQGNHSGIQWIIYIDCPGGHAAPLKIVTGLETLERDDDDDENDDIGDIKEIQNMVGMQSQSAVQGASSSASDLTSNSKSLRVPQHKSKFASGAGNHDRLQKITQSVSGLDSRGVETALNCMAQEVASDDSISSDDTIEGSEVLMMEEEENYEEIEEKDNRPSGRLKEAQGDVDDFSDDDDSSCGSEASEDNRDRYLDEDDQSIDPMEIFSPRTSQDSQDDDLIADLPSGILTESSTVLESCSTIEFSIAGSGPDIEEFDNGGNSVARKDSSRINFNQSLSDLPEEAVLPRAEMKNYDKSGDDDDKADQETEPGGEQATSSSASQVRQQAEHSSARHKSKKSRRHVPAGEKSSRRSKTFNASMPELQPEKDSSARHKSSKSRRHKPTEEKSSKPVKDSNSSKPELQLEKDSSDRSKISKTRRHKSAIGKSSRSVEDSNVSMPELQPKKDPTDRSKRGKARRNKSTPEKSSKRVEDFNASMPELHRVPDIGEDFESDSYFGLQGNLTSAVLKREALNRVSDQDLTGPLPSIPSESSSSAYNNEQKDRNPIQRTKSAPFTQLDLSAKAGIQVCENKETGEKKSRRRAPSRSKSSDDGMLNFAQLDLTGDSSGVQFHDNETVNPSDSLTAVEKRSRRWAHNRSHSADDNMLNFAQLDLMGESGVQFHDNETVNLADSPVAEKKSLRRVPGRSKSADSTLNFVPPQSAVEEEPDSPPSPEVDRIVQTPTHIEAPTPRSIRRLVKMGSNLIGNRKLNKSSSNLKASDPESKKRFMSFGNASFGSHRDLGDLLDDDESFD